MSDNSDKSKGSHKNGDRSHDDAHKSVKPEKSSYLNKEITEKKKDRPTPPSSSKSVKKANT